MKKKIAALALIAVVGLTACDRRETSSDEQSAVGGDVSTIGSEPVSDIAEEMPRVPDGVPISEYRQKFNEDVQSVKAMEFDNFDFSDCVFRYGATEDVLPMFRITEPQYVLSEDFTLDGFIEDIKRQCAVFFPGREIDMEELVCDASVSATSRMWPRVVDNYDGLKDGSIKYSWICVGASDDAEREKYDDVYAVWNKSDILLPYRMAKGGGRDLFGTDSLLASYIPGEGGDPVAVYSREEITPDMTCNLTDGEAAITDCIDFLENEYLEKIGVRSDFGLKVSDVEIYEPQPGIFAYNFHAGKTFKGIPFDAIPLGTHYSPSSDGKEYNWQSCRILMIESSDVDSFLDIGVHKPYEVLLETTELVPLSRAAEIASQKLTDSLVFDVRKAELVYSTAREGVQDRDHPDLNFSVACPEWKFYAYNENDGYTYVVYVNAQTAESRYQKLKI